MAKRIQQVRFYSKDSDNNNYAGAFIDENGTVSTYTGKMLYSGLTGEAVTINDNDNLAIYPSPFKTPIIQIGIQALPGTKVYFNGATFPIEVGVTGIYELDVEDFTYITEVKFDADSLNNIDSNPNTYLIVDTIWDDSYEEVM